LRESHIKVVSKLHDVFFVEIARKDQFC